MTKIRNGGPWGLTLERQLERIAEEYVNEESRAYMARTGKAERWEDHLLAWVDFSITNPALEVSFFEWERLRRRDQRPTGKILRRP